MREELIRARGSNTQVNVAAQIGISQKYLSKLELGKRTPSMKIAARIASYYQSTIERLFPDVFAGEKSPKSSI